MANDIFSNIDALPDENIRIIADRLDARSQMDGFAAMRDDYFDRMDLAPDAQILELGGGTGVIGRAYAKRAGFSGRYVVSDLSQALIDYARETAVREGLDRRMDFKVIDAMTGAGLDGETYDGVVLHTLLSHVPDPAAVLRTAAAATGPGGLIAVFDADYMGMVIASGDDELDAIVSKALRNGAVAQPTVMRRVPQMAGDLGLERVAFLPTMLAEAGGSEFFISLAQAVCNVVMAQGGLESDTGQRWLAALETAIEKDAFFAMNPYFTYLYRKK
jgi:ubiquinone/menaquinone biosynthesis C-methylase UbiE